MEASPMLSIHPLSFAAHGGLRVDVYGLDAPMDEPDNACRGYPGAVVVSVALKRRFHGENHDVVIRGPGCQTFDPVVLKDRAVLHFVIPLIVVKQAVEIRTHARFKSILAGPRVVDDAFVHGLALTLINVIHRDGVDAPEAGAIITMLAAHVGLEYAGLRRQRARATSPTHVRQ